MKDDTPKVSLWLHIASYQAKFREENIPSFIRRYIYDYKTSN